MDIRPADLDDARVATLLETHRARAVAETGAGCAHALGLDDLRTPDIRVWAAWDDEGPAGVVALRRLDDAHGELKSMFTADRARGRGVASALLAHLLDFARADRMRRISLETGSWPYFDAARALYVRHGFAICPPFGDYRETVHSVYMTRALDDASTT
jgi:putative acetyltransferase